MTKVLIVTDSKDTAAKHDVESSLKKDGCTVTIVDDIRYRFELYEPWDAYIVWVDSITTSHAIARDIREQKTTNEKRASIAVWQPTTLSIGSGISVIHEVGYFATAVHNMISKEKEVRKKE